MSQGKARRLQLFYKQEAGDMEGPLCLAWKCRVLYLILKPYNLLSDFFFPIYKTCSSKKFRFEPFYIWFGAAIDYQASLVAQSVRNLPAMQETRVKFLGWEDPQEKEMATHSSILAWRIP